MRARFPEHLDWTPEMQVAVVKTAEGDSMADSTQTVQVEIAISTGHACRKWMAQLD